MKLTFNTFILLLFCYLGFIQNIVFFKVVWFSLFALVTFMMILFFIALFAIPEKFSVVWKDTVIKNEKCFISRNLYLSLIWGITSVGIQFYMIYPTYSVFASIYFIISCGFSLFFFSIRKKFSKK